MEKRKIILDCDPGYDDAVAIIIAGKAEQIELIGITTVSGNTNLECTSNNALNLVEYLGIEVPVCIGQGQPLVREKLEAGKVHGLSGLDGVNIPSHTKQFYPKKSVEFIIENCLKYPKDITIVTTGPMTNLALAIRLEPKIIECISEVISMGGSNGKGNVTPAAEFNIYGDPEAAHIVFSSGIKIKMIGLDITNTTLTLTSVIQRMEKIKNRASQVFCEALTNYNANRKNAFGQEFGGLHDPVTIAYMIDSNLVNFQPMQVTVDINHGPSYGRTNCDDSIFITNPNAEVGMKINVDLYWDIIEKHIMKYSN